MPKFPALTGFIKEKIIEDPDARPENYLRAGRHKGLFTTGARGKGGPNANAIDAAGLLLSVLASDTPTLGAEKLELMLETKPSPFTKVDIIVPGISEEFWKQNPRDALAMIIQARIDSNTFTFFHNLFLEVRRGTYPVVVIADAPNLEYATFNVEWRYPVTMTLPPHKHHAPPHVRGIQIDASIDGGKIMDLADFIAGRLR